MDEQVFNVIILNEMLNSSSFGFRRFLQGYKIDLATVRKITKLKRSKEIPY